MASDDAIQLLTLLILVILSAFSSAETALTTVNRIRLKALSDEGDRRADIVLRTIENSPKMLSTILIGNNLVNNFSAALATALAIKLFGNGAVGIVTGILTILILIFGEITPKTFATVNAEKLSLAYASVILFLMKLLTPVIFIINHICRFILRLMHVNADASLNTITEQELRTIVDVSHQEGVIEKEERQMIYNVVDFGDSQAKDIMVPRADIAAISEDASYEEVKELFHTERYSRLPVYREDRDNITGILNIKDFLFCSEGNFRVTDVMYEPYYTYEYKKTSELLLDMQKNSVTLSIVLDEYGAAVGLVSLEDLLEEIVGEIRDEYDDDEKDLIQTIREGEYLIEGSVKLDDINDALELSLHSEDYDSVGGLVIEMLDHLPTAGESVETDDGIRLTVDQMDNHRIETVRLILPKPEESADNE